MVVKNIAVESEVRNVSRCIERNLEGYNIHVLLVLVLPLIVSIILSLSETCNS